LRRDLASAQFARLEGSNAMRPNGKRLSRLIWIGAIIILIGDLAGISWSNVATVLATPDIDHLAELAALVYAQVRSLILALSVLAGMSTIVETLDKMQRDATNS
jgi:hypothetical protein